MKEAERLARDNCEPLPIPAAGAAVGDPGRGDGVDMWVAEIF